MKRDDLYDLAAFVVVAEHGSFTRAAAELGMSQSALSYAIKMLEERMGVRLLSRTTRSVSTTEAGETLLRSLRPALQEIASGVEAVGAMRNTPSGTVRLTATRHAVSTVLMPMLSKFHETYPDVQIDIVVDDNMVDIVAERFDAGIRFGYIVEKDMIAVRVGPDLRMAVVGAPSYFANRPMPQTPRELAGHRCLNYRKVRTGTNYAWEFEENGKPFEVRVNGLTTFNSGDLMLEAALAGHGIAYIYDDVVAPYVKSGALVQILDTWCPAFPGYYLYHPNRRQVPPPLAALIASLHYRG